MIDPIYGSRVVLRCVNHPNLRWHTKNIDFIGARSIFFSGEWAEGKIIPSTQGAHECSCPGSDLEVVPLVAL